MNFDKQSAPPTITLSNLPLLIILTPNIIALVAEEHAVLIVVVKPVIPKLFAIFKVESPNECGSIYFLLSTSSS